MQDFANLTFGIEIETVGASREALAKAIQSVVGGDVPREGGHYDAWTVTAADRRVWKVVSDASLTNNAASGGGANTGEIVSPILAYSDMATLQEVVRAVRAKAKAKVNSSCGVHVHVGSNALPTASICNLVKMVHKNEDLLYAALGVAEGRKARYCKPVESGLVERIEKKRPKTLEELKAVWYNGEYPNIDPSTIHYHESRYHGLNLHNVFYRHTIEFRYFEGTLHAGKIKAYVQLVLCLAKSALKAASAQSGKRPYNPASGRYDFRVLLNRLGMTGPEFATARLHLLSKLAGDCAFKNGRPAR